MFERLYRSLYRIRRVEEEVARVYASDKIKSPVHLSIGQEAVSAGVCAALLPRDVVFGTYRGHALYLAKGGDIRRLVAELFGKVTGCARGKGGSMHLIDTDAGVMGTSAVVGTTIANAVGCAYALKHRRQSAVVVSFFGDGATEEGVFAETAGGVTVAVTRKLIEQGRIARDEEIVICITGNGLKTQDAVADVLEQSPVINPTLDEFEPLVEGAKEPALV